ncbi:MAG: hypothetical protein HC798_03315, partial [Polaribacter sp.]|nr:hypothetical protein [Polaribacter sp.]
MEIEKYISELLYRYDCVIIPDFGGFVTNKIAAKLDVENHSIYPPTKQLSFNSNLKHNDGLLANYIATSENISYEKANLTISLSVIQWQKALRKSDLALENLGVFSLNNHQLIQFEPRTSINYLTSSFGFSAVVA